MNMSSLSCGCAWQIVYVRCWSCIICGFDSVRYQLYSHGFANNKHESDSFEMSWKSHMNIEWKVSGEALEYYLSYGGPPVKKGRSFICRKSIAILLVDWQFVHAQNISQILGVREFFCGDFVLTAAFLVSTDALISTLDCKVYLFYSALGMLLGI